MKLTFILTILFFSITTKSYADIKQSDVVTFNCTEIEEFLKTGNKNKEVVEFSKRLKKRKCK